MKNFSIWILIVTGVWSALPAWAQESAASPDQNTSSTQLTLDDLRTFTDVFNQVRQNYVEPVDDKTLLNAAITGMLSELDPHSAYLPGSDFEDLENSARGEYVGLGIDVAAEQGRVVVKQVISPGPADSAGINPGDIITAVDGKPVKGRLLQDSIDDLNGPEGSSVELKVLSPGGKTRNLMLKREYVKIPALSFRLLDEHYGYFRIVYFHRDSATDLKAAIDSVLEDGIQLYGLILDLRDNPGGVLQPAIEIADGFLDEGKIVSMEGRSAAMYVEFSAKPGQWLPGIPLVILVDRGSASASEVLAGALQDNHRAAVIGERTFGKGSVQSVLPLRNGAGIKLTTARYYTPSGKSIQAQGIVPDMVVANAVEVISIEDERIQEADLDRHLDNETDAGIEIETDTVSMEEDFPLHEALNFLRVDHLLSRSGEVEMN